MEGSISAINNHSIDQEIGENSILNDLKNTPESLKSEEHLPSDSDCSSSNTDIGEPGNAIVSAKSSRVDKTPRTDSVTNLYLKGNKDKHESNKKHVSKLRISTQEDVPSQTRSQGNHHYLNPQLFSLYGREPGYAFFGPFMTGYYPSYVGHFLQQGQSSSSTSFGAHLVPHEPFFTSYFTDQKFHLPLDGSLKVSAPRNMEIFGHGNRPFLNHMARNSKKLSVLEELKSNNGRNFELSDIKGRIVDFSVDQQGSRFIQQKLEHCSDEDRMTVFNEVVPQISRLMVDIFGNYVIQKLLELGNAEQRKKLAEKLSGKMLCLSLHKFGCRVIQKALEVINLEQKLPLIKELDGHLMKCVHDQNGNHVIQKCIECLPIQETGFIISSIQGQVPKLAIHPYGFRVIQSALEHYLDESQCRWIVNEILESTIFLSQDHYGNYVVQSILKRGKLDDRSQVIGKMVGKVVEISRHKYASNVVEKCLEYGNTKEQELLIEEILDHSNGEDNLLAMMKDQYGNYVVQKAFDVGNERQREALTSRVKVNLRSLRKYTFGEHIAALCERLSVKDHANA